VNINSQCGELMSSFQTDQENDMPKQPPAPLHAYPSGKTTKLSEFVRCVSTPFSHMDTPIFASRWLLYVIHIGLVIALAVYVFKCGGEVVNLTTHALELDSEEVMVKVLGIIDQSMIANLIVMINIGGFQIFIHRLRISPSARPQWLDHLDSMMMKVKVSVSIASITGIGLLRDFVNIEHYDDHQLKLVYVKAGLHIICLVSAFAFSAMWWLTHDKPTEHRNRELPGDASEHESGEHGDKNTASPHEGGEHAEHREEGHH
jgi:uncharacterized protein (TIGR00645 family)